MLLTATPTAKLALKPIPPLRTQSQRSRQPNHSIVSAYNWITF